MAEEDWKKVREIFDSALNRQRADRQSFIENACGDDKILLGEIESLLVSLDSADNFLEKPAVEKVADAFLGNSQKLKKDQCLRHYKIIRELGSGGMGGVYLATDTKLNRQVALKILHQDLLSDKHANNRLLREAQAAAMLDHPNICAIHEISETDDASFIVMQYIEGETLADVLTKRPSIETSLDLAIQVVDALSEAHKHRIIHRDIKPANIIVNERGQVKVLDFGLAKVVEAESSTNTAKGPASSGSMMGTVPYMSPEQLRGKPLDARTDIFSFGALFFEMLCGQQAFAKESNAETISAILNEQPDWTRIPPGLQPIVQKSLRKKRDDRYRTADDLKLDLRETQKSGKFLLETGRQINGQNPSEAISTSPFKRFVSRETAGSKAPSYRFWKSSGPSVYHTPETDSAGNQQPIKSKSLRPGYAVIFAAFTMFLLVGAAGWGILQLNNTDDLHAFDNLRSVRLVSWKNAASRTDGDYRVSNDGKMVAYSSTQDGPPESIFVKQTADGAEIRVTKDEWNNLTPVWSPDGQRIAFSSVRENQSGIYSIPAFSGVATPLKIFPSNGNLRLRHWSKDGAVIFYELEGNLFRLDIASQDAAQITGFEPSRREIRYFSVSPDEKSFAYINRTDGQTDLWMASVAGGTAVQLTKDQDEEMLPKWHPDCKRILYTVLRGNYHQINVAFTDARPPRQVTQGESEYKLIDVSGDGTNIYYKSQEKRSDIWGVKAETGEEFEVATGLESEYWPDFSPDGQSVAYQSNASVQSSAIGETATIIIKSLKNKFSQLSVRGINPRWLPGSRRVAFQRASGPEKKVCLWLVDSINGEERQVTKTSVIQPSISLLPYNRNQPREFGWSAGVSKIAFLSGESGARNILTTSHDSDETIDLTGNADPGIFYYGPLWSPGGEGLAFVSQPISAPKGEIAVSKIWIAENGPPKEIYSGPINLRLLGWASDRELILEKSSLPMAATPRDITLFRISLEGRTQFETVFKQIYVTSMSLSADGKTVVYTSRQDDKDNIFVASTKTGALKRITNNNNSRVFFGSPALSPDGKTVFFDKQEETNIISRLENFD